MNELLTYAILTLLVAVPLERWRIARVHGEKANIDHRVSWLIGFSLFAFVVIAYRIWGWDTIVFAVLCVAERGVLYDPALNILNGKSVDYQSVSSDNESDSLEVRILGKNFWIHRLAYLIIFIIAYIGYSFLTR